MKQLFLTASLFVVHINCFCQHVGIGTVSPQATLDVKGGQRIGGLSSYIKYDSATGRIEWTNANLYVPVTQALMKHSAAADGLFYNNTAPVSGQLEYRNAAGDPVFFTNFTNGNGYFGGHLSIGTTMPGAKLHVFTGASGYNGTYVPGAAIEGSGDTYLNFFTPGANESGVYFGRPFSLYHGGIVYNSPSSPNSLQFRTNGNQTRMIVDGLGNVGIGITNPTYKLHVNAGPVRFEGVQGGAALSMSSAGAIMIDAPFIPGGRLYMQENGYTGLGITNPAYRLDVNGRIRIRPGGASAGIWLNNGANSEAAFIGMEDDAHVGLFGNNGAGWKFSMNTQNGALKINGSLGSTGQVLKSNGSGQAPSWSNPLNAFYNNLLEYPQSAPVVMVPQTSYALPGMSNISLSISSVSKIIVSASVEVERSACGGCASSEELLMIQIVSPSVTTLATGKLYLFPSEEQTITIPSKFITLNPNNYTITTYLISGVGSNATARDGRLNIIVIPQ